MSKIYYTGLGAKKTGIHTEKEFLNIMNKLFKEACIDYFNSKKCKECREYKKKAQKMYGDLLKNNVKSMKNKKTLKTKTIKNNRKKFDQVTKKLEKWKNKCTECQRKLNRRECTLKEYIEYSGAELQ
jgi:peptidoglycan hydrolase CwlO-like protein